MLKKGVLPLLLILALLVPSAAWAAAPDIPAFSGAAAVEQDGNVPAFTADDETGETYVKYSELDALGRPGPATACLGREALRNGPHAENGDFLPVGWKTVRYTVKSEEEERSQYLYSVCRLIPSALGGSDADVRNAFTGTRYLRTEGMQPYEELVAGFLARTAYHILYRVTPVYEGDAPVARGVRMEAYSVEDAGRTLSFNVFLYNIQPGIKIDYTSGACTADAAVKVSASAETLLAARAFPPLDGTAQPLVGSFSEIDGNSSGASSKTPASSSTKQQTTSTGTKTKSSSSQTASTSYAGTEQGSASAVAAEQEKTRSWASGFIDKLPGAGDDMANKLRYDDSAYEKAVYGTGDDWD